MKRGFASYEGEDKNSSASSKTCCREDCGLLTNGHTNVKGEFPRIVVDWQLGYATFSNGECCTGEKKILIKTTENEQNHFTVVLACRADETKLKQMSISKRKTTPKEHIPPTVQGRLHLRNTSHLQFEEDYD